MDVLHRINEYASILWCIIKYLCVDEIQPKEPVTFMAGNSAVKMSGYLEKKGKLKMVSSWKTYWFVLEGRLLLYYKSKDDEHLLSPCKGSINLGPSCSVKPLLGTSCVFQIETRANTIVLKAKTRLDQERWMQAILAALNHNSKTNGMIHFRYSSDDLIPRKITELPSKLSRQYTLPTNRLKLEKRHTFCRSFETIQSNFKNRPKSTIIRNSKNSSQPIIMIENTEYVTQDDIETSSRKNDSIIIENVDYCAVPVPNLDENPSNQGEENEYYAMSPLTEAERQLLRKRSLEKNYHIYERISGESANSGDLVQDNTLYASASEIQRPFLKPPDENIDDVSIESDIYNAVSDKDANCDILVENDEYCTPDIVVTDTNLVSYHEYNLPDKNRHIYSVPNFDHNDNRIRQDRSRYEDDVNPYSVCHLYPKSKMASKSTDRKSKDVKSAKDVKSSKDEYALYDNPLEFILSPHQQEGNVNKILRKFKNPTNKKGIQDDNIDKKVSVTKKANFLQKLFRKNPNKKKEPPPEDNEEIEYAQIDEEVVKKMDMAYCIDKKLLTELEMILQLKRLKLKEYLDIYDNNSTNANSDDSPRQEIKRQTSTGTTIKPKVPLKPPPKQTTSVDDDKYTNLKTIDEILDDLEEMKRTNSLTGGKVRCLIEKFNQTVAKKNISTDEITDDIPLRQKNYDKSPKNSHNSNDELSKLLCELAKVTNAPLLTPGVTSSLGVTSSTKDVEFLNLIPKIQRRHSEPDYDIPRPHSNLKITKDNDKEDDVLTATRFFGPVLPNYETKDKELIASITPDSLENDASSSNVTDVNLTSYSSHKYENFGNVRYYVEKHIQLDDEVFIDSLEPHTDCF
ncbi:PH domain [Popillia japonica]|uniref:PH domain n=1 Tax=Popillia japonica TaxID=7064 RepID=A0AAW1MKM9_POPJA